jgi:hypothetical protein
MKIGFKKGHKWYSGITRGLTTSQWSHAGAWIGDRFYESTALKGDQSKSGVRDYPVTTALAQDYEWFEYNIPDELALARYNQIKDCAYDYFSLLSFLFLKVRDSKRYYCYEAVLYMMIGAVDERATPEVILTYMARLQKEKDGR